MFGQLFLDPLDFLFILFNMLLVIILLLLLICLDKFCQLFEILVALEVLGVELLVKGFEILFDGFIPWF